ncbi:hypothetical protein Hanom_Chr16g01449241 [Helianthus anomalus]
MLWALCGGTSRTGPKPALVSSTTYTYKNRKLQRINKQQKANPNIPKSIRRETL